jgi:hypothetical protein
MDLVCARELGATFNREHHGFHNRNKMVARSDYLIAFTWGESNSEPKEGGAFHTWSCWNSRWKVHIPLSTFYAKSSSTIFRFQSPTSTFTSADTDDKAISSCDIDERTS